MPRPRFENLPQEQRTNLLDTAAAAFASAGYHEVSYNKILSAAKISKGASYYYFDDKEDLFLTVAERELDALFASLEPVVPQGEFWEHVEALLDRYLTYASQHPQSVALAAAAADFTPKASGVERMARWNAHYSSLAQSILEVGQTQGVVRTDIATSLLSTVVLHIGEAVDTWILGHDPISEETLNEGISAFLDVTRRALAPGTSTSD